MKYLLFLLCLPLTAATYYVSNSGSDSNNGTSAGTPWQTIAHVNAQSFSPGDSILFQDGGIWREQLIVPSAGSGGNKITIASYGSGAPPVISGSNVISGWTSSPSGGTNFGGEMQAYWEMEQATGASAPDGTGDGNNLVNNGTVVQSTNHIQGSYSASFVSASSQYFSLTDGSLSSGFVGKNGTSNQTFSMGSWVWLNTTSGNQYVISKGFVYTLYWNGGGFCFQMNDGGNYTTACDSGGETANTWYHVAVTYAGSTTKALQMYINGSASGSPATAVNATITVSTATFGVGANQSGTAGFNGLLDEVWVTGQLLTAANIQSIYAYGLLDDRATTIYYSSDATQPNQVFRNGSRLAQVSAKILLVTGSWWWDSTDSYVWVYDNPSGYTMEASARTYGINANGKSYLIFTGLIVEDAQTYGLYISTSSGVLIAGMTSFNHYYGGIRLENQTGAVVTQSIGHDNGYAGITVLNSPSVLIDHDVAYNNCSQTAISFCAGIKLEPGYPSSFTNPVVQYSVAYNNGLGTPGGSFLGTGIWMDSIGSGTICRYNVTYGNNQDGIFVDGFSGASVYGNVSYNNGNANTGLGGNGIDALADGASTIANTQIYNNTIWGNYLGGILIAGPSSEPSGGCVDNTIQNNIVTGTTNGANLRALYGCDNPSSIGSGNVYTYNAFGPQASNFLAWGGTFGSTTYYATYAAWEMATGNCGTTGCSHSLESAVSFVNTTSGDFRLPRGAASLTAGSTGGSIGALDVVTPSLFTGAVTLSAKAKAQ